MVTRDIVQRLLNVINDTRRRVNTLESREYVLLAATQTLTNKTLTTPTIGDFSNAQHSHADAAGGGQLSLTTAVSGVLPPANGGTGVNNDTRTLTINTNSGTLAFSGAGYTLTIPATGTAALLGTANVFTADQSVLGTIKSDANLIGHTALLNTFRSLSGLSPVSPISQVLGLSADAGIGVARFSNNNVSGNFYFAKSRGATIGTYAITKNNDSLGQFIFEGSDGTNFGAAASVGAFVDDTPGNDNMPGRLVFATSPSGTQAPVGRMTIKSSGNVGIGTASPSAQLHVDQPSSTAAKPTLRLRQADLSEEFIRFDTTVGAGNPINTTALGAYYGRVRVWVEGVGAKWLALYD